MTNHLFTFMHHTCNASTILQETGIPFYRYHRLSKRLHNYLITLTSAPVFRHANSSSFCIATVCIGSICKCIFKLSVRDLVATIGVELAPTFYSNRTAVSTPLRLFFPVYIWKCPYPSTIMLLRLIRPGSQWTCLLSLEGLSILRKYH